jgi:hypothetical protein
VIKSKAECTFEGKSQPKKSETKTIVSNQTLETDTGKSAWNPFKELVTSYESDSVKDESLEIKKPTQTDIKKDQFADMST